jgi:nucleotide-binding universal stress UspA family protein
MPDCILAMIDFSDVTPSVVASAARLAQAMDAELLLLHIGQPDPDFVGYEVGPDTVRQDVARELKDEHRRLAELAESASSTGLSCRGLMVQGPTVETALEQAQRHSATWIVLGSHGHGALFNLLVGSVSEGVLHGANCPVVVIPSPRN